MGRVKVHCATPEHRFWLFFAAQDSIADLQREALRSLELPQDARVTFLLDGCELLKKSPCAMLGNDDVIQLVIGEHGSTSRAAAPSASALSPIQPGLSVPTSTTDIEMNGHQLPLPPPPKRRKLGFDTTRLLEVPLPATLPYEELMLPRVLPGAPAAVEQDHLDSMRKALMNDTLLPEEEASDGDFRPGLDEGSDDSRGSDMDVTSDEDEGYDVTIPVHRSVIKGAGPTAGQGGLIEALTNPRSRSVAATDEPVQNGAQNDTTPQELVSPRYQPSSPGIRVPTPPPMASTKNVISPKPAIPATAVASTSSSSVSSSSSSDSSSSSSSNESDSSSSSSSSSSDSSSSSSSDNDDEEPNTSAMLKPVNPQPRLVNGNTAKKTLAGLVKSAPPGQGKSRTANRNMRRRRAKALKNAALGTESSNAPTIGPQRPAGADEDVAAAKAAALSVLDRVAQTDQQEDSAAALAASKKLKDKAAQRKAEVISQNDLHHQLQAHYRQQQHSNYVVPPSQKEIPANVFVTSIDVEQPEWASHGDVEDGLGEVEGIAEDQEEYVGWEGWPSLDRVAEQWRSLEKVAHPTTLKKGSKIAFQVAELNVETFTPEVVMYHGEVTHAPPPATSVDENLMPTMAGQQASTKEEYWLSVALHPSSMRPDGEEAEERDYSWNDLADCRHLVL